MSKRSSFALSVLALAGFAWAVACSSTNKNSPSPTATSTASSGTSSGETSSGETSSSPTATSTASSGTSSGETSSNSVVIDNQSNYAKISLPNGGSWYVYGDGSGSSVPPISETSGISPGDYVLETFESGTFPQADCLSITGDTGNGYGEGFRLAVTGSDGGGQESGATTFNASQYAGISFYAMSITSTPIQVMFPDSDTDDPDFSIAPDLVLYTWVPTCLTADAGPCNNSFQVTQTLTPAWTQYFVSFLPDASPPLAQANYPSYMAPALKLSALTGINFQVNGPGTGSDGGPGLSAEFCIADIEFTR